MESKLSIITLVGILSVGLALIPSAIAEIEVERVRTNSVTIFFGDTSGSRYFIVTVMDMETGLMIPPLIVDTGKTTTIDNLRSENFYMIKAYKADENLRLLGGLIEKTFRTTLKTANPVKSEREIRIQDYLPGVLFLEFDGLPGAKYYLIKARCLECSGQKARSSIEMTTEPGRTMIEIPNTGVDYRIEVHSFMENAIRIGRSLTKNVYIPILCPVCKKMGNDNSDCERSDSVVQCTRGQNSCRSTIRYANDVFEITKSCSPRDTNVELDCIEERSAVVCNDICITDLCNEVIDTFVEDEDLSPTEPNSALSLGDGPFRTLRRRLPGRKMVMVRIPNLSGS